MNIGQITAKWAGLDPARTALVDVPSARRVSFATLVSQWHLANYVEDLPAFLEPSGRLRYKSWDFAAAFDARFFFPYPLQPDSVDATGYSASGTLRGGSGAYLRVVQGADGAPVALGLNVRNSGAVSPRYAVVRLR